MKRCLSCLIYHVNRKISHRLVASDKSLFFVLSKCLRTVHRTGQQERSDSCVQGVQVEAF